MNATTKAYLRDRYDLHYVDYRESVDAKLMAECLRTKDASPIWDIVDTADDMALDECVADVRERMEADGYGELFAEDEDEIRDWVSDHDRSNPVKELCRHSSYRVRLVQHSNHDCWVPPYDAGTISYDGAFREAVDMLALNPAEVKKALAGWADCEGRWPDRPKRNPVVSVKDFSMCCLNMSCYGLWGFFGSVRGSFLHDNEFRIHDADVIPRGTFCGWCNWWNGGATLEPIRTLRDVTVRELKRNLHSKSEYTYVEFELDERDACNGYSILPEVYGDRVEKPLFVA